MRLTARAAVSWMSVVGLLAFVAFAPSLGRSLWAATLHNFAHGPVFGCIALAVLIGLRETHWFAALRRLHQYPIALAVAALLGAATELAQMPTGRDASWFDLGNDVLGAIAFLATFAVFDPAATQRRTPRKVAVLMGVATVASALLIAPLVLTAHAYSRRAAAFPVIVQFSQGVGLEFLHARLADIDVEPLPQQWSSFPGERALLIEFRAGSWPGIEIKETQRDWRGYRSLLLDVTNPQGRALELNVRIDDAKHDGRFADRFNRRFAMPAATRTTLRIPLSDIEAAPRERAFDLANVTRIFVFQSTVSSAEQIYVSGMWLE